MKISKTLKPSPFIPIPSTSKIKSQARKETVLITGKGHGTGIIIGQDGNNYYVLTSKHVVGIEPSENIQLPTDLDPDEQHLPTKEDPYKIIAYDGQEYEIKYNKEVTKDSQFDLAIIKFDSRGNKYPSATLATSSLFNNQTVYIYGLKDCIDKTREQKEEFNQGAIVLTKSSIPDEGYSVQYTNPTITGMSGSPVYDATGRVVAIHGKPGKRYKDKEYKFQDCPSLTPYYGNNYGISMETFKKSGLINQIPVQLAFQDTSLPTNLPPDKPDNNPDPKSSSDNEIHFRR